MDGRTTGACSTLHGLGLHDHVCWPVESDEGFVDAVRPFLVDGLRLGARCVVVAPARSAGLVAEMLSSLGPHGASVECWAPEHIYAPDEPVRAHETVAGYEATTLRALADGHSGFRVAADVSSLLHTVEQRDAFADYEIAVDRLMQRLPMSAACACVDHGNARGVDVPSAETMSLAALHPARKTGSSPFSLTCIDGGAVALAGEVDRFQSGALTSAWEATCRTRGSDHLVVDASQLTFVDHRSLLALDRVAQAYGCRVDITGAPPVLVRLVSLLELATTTVVSAREAA